MRTKQRLWVDCIGLVLSSIFIALGMELLKVSETTNYLELLINVVVLLICFLLGLAIVSIFRYKGRPVSNFLSIPVGLVLWLVAQSAIGLLYDWRYISAHPENVAARHLLMVWFRVGLIPFFGIFALFVMWLLRVLGSVFTRLNQRPELD